MGLAIQPHKVIQLLSIPGAVDLGLVGRFFIVSPRSLVGHRTTKVTQVSVTVTASYNNLSLQLAHRLEFVEQPINWRLDPEAQDLFDYGRQELEYDIRAGRRLDVMPSWAGKLAGYVARIAALLHVIDHGPTDDIRADTANRAIALGHYLINHALALLDQAGADERMTKARKALQFIMTYDGPPENLTVNTINEKYRWRADDGYEAIKIVEEHGWIRVREDGSGGGRPKKLIVRNPRGRLDGLRGPDLPSHPAGPDGREAGQ